MNLKERGFSLIGTIVAAAAGVIIMTALSQQMLSQTRSTRYLETKMEAMKLKQELTLLLTSDPNCDSSFAGLTGINVAGAVGGDSTDITTAIGTPATRPIKVLKDSYSLNNRLIEVIEVKLFKPFSKLGGAPNNSSPFEFKVRLTVQAKGETAMTKIVDGPTLSLNVAGTTVDANACADVTPKPLMTKTSFSVGKMSANVSVGSHNFCALIGVYQHGNNGYAGLTSGTTDAFGKANYTITSACAGNCADGALSVLVDCFDFQ